MENEPNAQDYTQEIALAHRVARIFGYDGLTIDVRDGAGWQTIRSEDEITLVVDPSMLRPTALKDALGADLSPDTPLPEQYSVYGISHELGHIDDFMQPKSEREQNKNAAPAEHFFWNALDDGVINRRLRNIPLLNSLTGEIYRDILFPPDDYTDQPKHTQFMYGWLFRNVTPERQVSFSQDVVDALDSLETVGAGGGTYDLYRTLTHPGTTYRRRHELARTHILPLYKAFLEEDKKADAPDMPKDAGLGNRSGQSSSDNGADADTWEAIYEAYSEASHCGQNHHQQDAQAGQSDAGNDPHEAIKEVAEAMREQAEKQAAQTARQQQNQQANTEVFAGSIAAELALSENDARAYIAMTERYRPEIFNVARVLQHLAVPSIEYTSPRYRRQPDISGLKLSPNDLFRVIVAHESEMEPPVWKPVETVSKKEGLTFNGLDIHLVIDSSGSMAGAKAESAAACGIMLMEGLALARRMVQRQAVYVPKPDVRLQVILFGSSAKVVAPLGYETPAKDKGVTFTTVRRAASMSTLVTDALQLTVQNGQKHPRRTQLVYLITDGEFHDRSSAMQQLRNAGENYFPYQYILLSPSTTPIAKQASHITNPSEMPGMMHRQLVELAARFLA